MKRILAAVLLLVALPLRADPAIEAVQQAQRLLGPSVWSQAIRITNASPDARYGGTVHALVFETAEILWLYVAGEGTQSLSLHVGRTEEEKRDLAPLLRAIAPGFVRHEMLPPDPESGSNGAPLPNGCFIDAIVALRDRVAFGELIAEARLFTYYANVSGKTAGHTVLLYETPGRLFVIDPSVDRAPRIVPPRLRDQGARLARWLRPDLHIVQTRSLSLEVDRTDGLYADKRSAMEAHLRSPSAPL